MTLTQWKNYMNITNEQIADALGIDASYVSLLARGLRVPPLKLADCIEDTTDGMVPVKVWLKAA